MTKFPKIVSGGQTGADPSRAGLGVASQFALRRTVPQGSEKPRNHRSQVPAERILISFLPKETFDDAYLPESLCPENTVFGN